jgi:cytochrome c556
MIASTGINSSKHPQRNAMPRLSIIATALLLGATLQTAEADDTRQPVTMPAPMREHMLANMRDHLTAMGEIQTALAKGQYTQAAEIAEQRIGMSSLDKHGASHMAPYMPKAMQDIGTNMHRAASRFARTAQEAAVGNDLARTLGALGELTQQCVACHTSFTIK